MLFASLLTSYAYCAIFLLPINGNLDVNLSNFSGKSYLKRRYFFQSVML